MLVEILNAITWPVAVLAIAIGSMIIGQLNKRNEAIAAVAKERASAEHKEKMVATLRDAFANASKVERKCAEETAKRETSAAMNCGSENRTPFS